MKQTVYAPWMKDEAGSCDIKRYKDDRKYMQSLYMPMSKEILSYVREECDKQEYEGSFIYDEVPDRQRLFDEADRIAGRFISEQSSRCFICTIAGILFNCELCRRRCRYRRYQRFW